jgi:hypothetical protein
MAAYYSLVVDALNLHAFTKVKAFTHADTLAMLRGKILCRSMNSKTIPASTRSPELRKKPCLAT